MNLVNYDELRVLDRVDLVDCYALDLGLRGVQIDLGRVRLEQHLGRLGVLPVCVQDGYHRQQRSFQQPRRRVLESNRRC